MSKAALISTAAVILVSRLVISLTFLHFVFGLSPTHAMTMVMAYLIMLIGERNLIFLTKDIKNDS
jgi:hypothetical protein